MNAFYFVQYLFGLTASMVLFQLCLPDLLCYSSLRCFACLFFQVVSTPLESLTLVSYVTTQAKQLKFNENCMTGVPFSSRE